MKNHMKIHINEGILCNICDYSSIRKYDMERHIETVHEGIKSFQCNVCAYKTGHKSHLNRHVEGVHEKIKPFKCDFCDYSTKEKRYLKSHIKRVHEDINCSSKENIPSISCRNNNSSQYMGKCMSLRIVTFAYTICNSILSNISNNFLSNTKVVVHKLRLQIFGLI